MPTFIEKRASAPLDVPPADITQLISGLDNAEGTDASHGVRDVDKHMWTRSLATLDALRQLSVSPSLTGRLVAGRIAGHTNAGAGGGVFVLNTSGTVGANQDNNGTRVHANNGTLVTDPAAWYWERVEDGNADDVRVWGGILGAQAGNAAGNDAAIANMIAAGQNIYLPPGGPLAISTKIALANQSQKIYQDNPNQPNAGGLLVVGVGTAQSDAIVEITNNRGHEILNVRFYGHLDSQSAASTTCALGVRIQSDTAQPVQYLASHWQINNCVFEREVANSTPFTVIPNFVNCVELSFVTDSANADQGVIYNCRFRNWAGVCIDVPNTQSVNVQIDHCLLDTQIGQGTNYQSAIGIRSASDLQVLNCSFNRMGTAIQGTSASHIVMHDFHVENVNMIYNAASEAASITLKDGKFIWQENAYTGATGIWLRFLNGQCQRVICDNVWFADQTGAATRPHMRLASRSTGSQGRSLFRFLNCREITLDDIDAESAVGVPSQQLRRLSENDKGTEFFWKNNADVLVHVDRSLDQNRLNLD